MNALVPASIRPQGTDTALTFHFLLKPVRVVMRDGEPWFVARDVCRAVSLVNVSDALDKLDDDEKGVASTDTPGGRQEVSIISEQGLYSLVLRCRGATTAETIPWRFRRWVTGEVLREIRKTGSYGVTPVDPLTLLADPAVLRQLLGDFAERTLRLQEENRALSIDLTCATAVIESQEPIVEAYAEIVETGEAVCITDAAKLIGVAPSALFEHMRDQDRREPWIYCRAGRPEVAYQTRVNRDELDQKAVPYKRPDGSVGLRSMVVVLPRGLFILRAEMQQRERDRRRAAGEFDL